jgi:hypothetical protein
MNSALTAWIIGPLIPACIVLYGVIAFVVYHRYRRRHVLNCAVCQRKIKENLTPWYGETEPHHEWNYMLCDRYDMGAPVIAFAWPIAWLVVWLYQVTAVQEKPFWLLEKEHAQRIEKLEREAGLR